MTFEFLEAHSRLHGDAVVDHVEIRFVKIYDSFTFRVFDVGVSNVPFVRYRPVENGRTARHFVNAKCNVPADDLQRGPQPVARDAATNWIEIRDQTVHLQPDSIEVSGLF